MRFRWLVVPLTALAGSPGIGLLGAYQAERAFVISGDVRLEDGSVPSDSVLIQRMCQGRAVFAARSDVQGHYSFSVETGNGNSATADASQVAAQASDVTKAVNQTSSQYTNPITSALRDCELQAVLSGFRTESVPIAVRSMSDNGRVGTMILHPLSRAGSLTISATTAAAPANARKAYEKGLEASSRQNWNAASDELTKAVTIYPRFAAAWYQLGQVRQNRNQPAGAVEAWNEARKQDPKYVKPYESLAALADRQQDWAAAEQYSREWLQLDPEDFAAAYLVNAVANARLNRVEAAERAARAGVRVDRDHQIPRLHYVLGLILMQKAEFAESAACLRTYLELAPGARDAATVREQLAKLEQSAASGRQR
jgi:tetratricopeptide (TPR) repeat protein